MRPHLSSAGRAAVFAAVSAPVWERRRPDAACAWLLCLRHSIPRRKSGAVPDGSHIGCTGGPGHRVAGRCTVDGSNESRWWNSAPPQRAPALTQLSHYSRPVSHHPGFGRSLNTDLSCYTAYTFPLGDRSMTQETVQIVAGVLAVLLIGIVIMRRKNKKKTQEDEF